MTALTTASVEVIKGAVAAALSSDPAAANGRQPFQHPPPHKAAR